MLGLIVALVSLAAGLYIASMQKQQVQQQDMSPNTLESFKTNTSNEGAVVPMIFGTVRISANYLWWGNLITEEVIEEVETGGKGGGGGGTEEVVVGYKYYLDLWLALCIGPNVSIIESYVNDKSGSAPSSLNPGDAGGFPDFGLEYATPMNPVAHVSGARLFIGENVGAVPTYHYVVKKTSDAPLSNANNTYGTNPAAVIYDLLREAGVPASNISLSTFQDACDYWHSKNYGINITIGKQEEVRNIINRVFTYVDGNLRLDSQDRFELKAWKDTDTFDIEISDKTEFKDFKFTRRTWEDVFTDFRANFTDSTQKYSQRTIRVINTAVREIVGYPKQITIDLTAYTDVDIASSRLWEMMKRLSYPEAQVTTKVSMKYYEYKVGDIVRINHDDYGITDADFRIIGIDLAKADSNDIQWSLTQVVENIFDANFVTSGGSEYTEPSYSPVVQYDSNVCELPYNEQTKRVPAYLLLCARKGAETSFGVLHSPAGTDYAQKHICSRWSQHGTIDEEYPAATSAIDGNYDGSTGYGFEGNGILYTFDREDPEFNDIARESLFTSSRIAILGNPNGDYEMVAFEKVEYVSDTQNRLKGVIRGVLNTTIQTHSVGAEIWITNIDFGPYGNVVSGKFSESNFFLKYVPKFGGETLDAGSAPAVEFDVTDNWNNQHKCVTPWGFNSAKVVKVGSTNTVTVEQLTQEALGAGTRPLETTSYANPPAVEGVIEWSINNFSTIGGSETSASFTVTQAGAFTLYLRVNLDGIYSAVQSMSVSASDDTYYLEDNMRTETSLEKIKWGAQGWKEVLSRNAVRLNDDVLKVSELFDVNDAGITNSQVLIWDAGTEKFIPEDYYVAFQTTTTSTTSSTTSTSSSTASSTSTVSTTSSSTSSSSSTTTNTASSTTSTTSSSSSSTTTNTASSTSSSTSSSTTTNTASSTSSSTSSTSSTASSSSTTTTSPPFPYFLGEDVSSGVTPDTRENHIR
jgi:hypothetical protein